MIYDLVRGFSEVSHPVCNNSSLCKCYYAAQMLTRCCDTVMVNSDLRRKEPMGWFYN